MVLVWLPKASLVPKGGDQLWCKEGFYVHFWNWNSKLGELPFLVLVILYGIELYILMHENLLLNQILVSFNFLVFVVCGFRESMRVFVVSIILSCLCELIIAMIIMILLSALTWCLEFFFYTQHTHDYYLLLLYYYYYYYYYYFIIIIIILFYYILLLFLLFLF